MLNWILTSSALIIIILLVRKLFGEKLTPGLQYGLWLLVLLRLLIPASFFHSDYSLSEMVVKTVDAVEWGFVTEGTVKEKIAGMASIYSSHSTANHTFVGGDVAGVDEVESYIISSEGEKMYSDDEAEETEKFHPDDAAEETEKFYPGSTIPEEEIEHTFIHKLPEEVVTYSIIQEVPEEIVTHIYVPMEATNRLRSWFSANVSVLYTVWFIGMAITGGIFLLLNLFFRIRIYSDREEIEEEELAKRELFSEIPVYVSKFVATPCIAGLRRSAVYLPLHLWKQNADSEDDREKRNRELEAMICHENVHFRHGDQLWGFLRLICLVLHWYNPFVWMAALASKQDAELFCDAGAIKELGEDNRYEYGRILIRMTAQEKKNFGRFADAMGHAGLCNTEMTDTKKRIEQRIKKLTHTPKKSTVVVALICLFCLMAVSYLFIGSGRRNSLFWEMMTENNDQQGEVIVKKLESQKEETAEENFYPRPEEVEEVRAIALAGMSEEEIDALTTYVKDYHNWIEYMLLYENWEKDLSDKENIAWNFIDKTGEVQAGWALESYSLEDVGDEREYLRQKYPEFGQISLYELRKKYGEPYYRESPYGAETVVQEMQELTDSADNEIFRADIEALCRALQQAKDTHEVGYVMQAHEILHDVEYFLLRYSPRDVAGYTPDISLSCKYYGVLEVWKAWQEGTFSSEYSDSNELSSEFVDNLRTFAF